MPAAGALIPRHIFITGGTGALGRCIVRTLLETSDASLTLLVRGGSPADSPDEYLERYVGAARPSQVHRIALVCGDVTQPGLGMAEADARRLHGEVDAVLHAAAITRFDEDLAVARATNVGGTVELLRWARGCSRLDRIAVLSTAYVAGRRTGLIRESDRAHHAGFVNSYEESKYLAEAAVEEAQRDLPISIYRVSTILGDSCSGRVDRFTAPHFALRLLWLGLLPMVPGSPDFPVELIPSDHAASVVADLFLARFKPGQRFHVVAGPEGCWPLQRVIDAARETFSALSADWRRRAYPSPSLVDADTYRLFTESVQDTGNILFQQVLGQLHSFSEQLLYPKTFDITEIAAALPGYQALVPPLDDYFPRVLEFCLRKEWGHGRGDRRADYAHS